MRLAGIEGIDAAGPEGEVPEPGDAAAPPEVPPLDEAPVPPLTLPEDTEGG